ncbi:MAG: hypoxanthine phosphoribosyltransferase [Ktedonobacterales bacterium]
MTNRTELDEALEGVLISAEAIQARVAELASELTRDYADKDLVLVGVLRGSVIFLADLVRQMTLPLEMDFITLSSYGNGVTSSGAVRQIQGLATDLTGRDVVIVEDIVDTGHTLAHLLRTLRKRHPASLSVCTLLAKGNVSDPALAPAYVGFTIPQQFVVGYGLDYAQKYRNLPDIAILKPEVYAGQDGEHE